MPRLLAHQKALRTAVTGMILIILASMIFAPAVTAAAGAGMSCSQYGDWNGYTTQVCYNHPLNVANPNITMAVIVLLPGNNQGGGVYGAAVAAGRESTTLIMAPTFSETNLGSTILYWSGAWRAGDYSVHGGVSSFDIIDRLVEGVAADRALFPNLNKVVVTGFSAGGQLANRYAAANEMQQRVYEKLKDGIQFRYLVGAPSIYVYMDNLRWNKSTGRFVDGSTLGCGGYNNYPYGLDYTGGWPIPDTDTVRTQYAQRQTIYIVGLLDTVVDGSLAQECQAQVQGLNRLERTRNYNNHIKTHYGALAANHSEVEVPNVGHGDVYNTTQGRAALFDNWPATYTISGVITDNMHLPLANLAVQTSVGSLQTNGSGTYSFTGLLPGAYLLTLANGGQALQNGTRQVNVPPSSTSQDFRLAPVLNISPTPRKAGSAFGATVAADLSSSPNKTIDVTVNGTKVGSVTSGADGAISFYLKTSATMQAGAYLVVLQALNPSVAILYVDPAAGTTTAPPGATILTAPDTIAPASQIYIPAINR